MSRIRRALAVTGLALAVAVGGAVPANATFADEVPLATTTITTGTVAPATQVEANGWCETVVDPVTGMITSTVHAMVEWQPSPSRGVIGYRVTAHVDNSSSVVVAETDAVTKEVDVNAALNYQVNEWTFSVTTLTDYGWTADSARTRALSC